MCKSSLSYTLVLGVSHVSIFLEDRFILCFANDALESVVSCCQFFFKSQDTMIESNIPIGFILLLT